MSTRTHKQHVPRKLERWMVVTALVLIFSALGIAASYVLLHRSDKALGGYETTPAVMNDHSSN